MVKTIFNPAVTPALTCARPAAWNLRQAHALGISGLGRYAGDGGFAGLAGATTVGVMRTRAVAGHMSRQDQEAPKPIQGIVADGVTDPPIWRRLART